DGEGDGASTDAAGVGAATFVFSVRRLALCSEAISSNRGLTMKKNAPASTPPPISRNKRTPAMIQGIFDFFFATGGGNGAEGAAAAGGTTTSAVLCFGCSTTGGGGDGGGGGVGGVTGGFAISEVPELVGPVFRGSATVAG